jgi:hypothetical protein
MIKRMVSKVSILQTGRPFVQSRRDVEKGPMVIGDFLSFFPSNLYNSLPLNFQKNFPKKNGFHAATVDSFLRILSEMF